MAKVWELSGHSGSELLMLLAIADFADDDGNAYPAVPTLAAKCRMTPRNANLILAALRASGELDIRTNEGPRGTNRYRIVMRGAGGMKPASPLKKASPLKSISPTHPEDHFTPEAECTLKPASDTPEAGFLIPLKPASDEPSLNHQEPSEAPPKLPRQRNAKGQSLDSWLEQVRAKGEKAIPAMDPIHAYAAKVNLPSDFLLLHWEVFKAKHLQSAKAQADWRAAFRNAVKGNWARLWYFDTEGECRLTSAGIQASREHCVAQPTAHDAFYGAR